MRRDSGQGDQEGMLSTFHKYLRHNQEDRDDFQEKEKVHFRQPMVAGIAGQEDTIPREWTAGTSNSLSPLLASHGHFMRP